MWKNFQSISLFFLLLPYFYHCFAEHWAQSIRCSYQSDALVLRCISVLKLLLKVFGSRFLNEFLKLIIQDHAHARHDQAVFDTY